MENTADTNVSENTANVSENAGNAAESVKNVPEQPEIPQTAGKPEKTYTEAEMEKIIAKRLAKAKSESDGKAEEALKKIEALEKKNACLAAGIKSDYTDDAVTLAEKLVNEKTDFSKALKTVSEKYPQFTGGVPPVSTGTKTKNSSEVTSDKALRRAFGLE